MFKYVFFFKLNKTKCKIKFKNLNMKDGWPLNLVDVKKMIID